MPKENKLVEFIRKILIKTVLPFRKKKEAFASKIRLSIRLRIAYVYGKIILIFGIVIILIFFLASLYLYESKCNSYADDVVESLKSEPEKLDKKEFETKNKFYYLEDNQYKEVPEYTKNMKAYIQKKYQERINPYIDKMNMRIIETNTKKKVYNDINKYVVDDSQLLGRAYVGKKYDGTYTLIAIEKRQVNLKGIDYTIFFSN